MERAVGAQSGVRSSFTRHDARVEQEYIAINASFKIVRYTVPLFFDRPPELRKMGSRTRKILLVALSGILPLLVLEAALRAVDYRPTGWWRYEGFHRKDDIFLEQQGMYVLAPGQERTFRTRQFPVGKAEDTTRILSIGDSITWGFQGNDSPHPLDAYSDVLQRLLAEEPGVGRFRVVNLGARTYASSRVLQIVEHALKYAPDLVIASFGSSEFLETAIIESIEGHGPGLPGHWRDFRSILFLKDLLYRLVGTDQGLTSEGLRERDEFLRAPFVRLEDILRDDRERQQIYRGFRDNLDALADACDTHGVRLALLTVPCNLRWPPFASVFESGKIREDVEEVLRNAGNLLERGKTREAVALLAPLVQTYPMVASLWYRLGEAYDALGNEEAAKKGYSMARDLDGLPLRATEAINRVIRKTADDRTGVHLVDVARLFEDQVPDSIPDGRLFLDNSHPREKGHRLIAEEILRILRREGLLGTDLR